MMDRYNGLHQAVLGRRMFANGGSAGIDPVIAKIADRSRRGIVLEGHEMQQLQRRLADLMSTGTPVNAANDAAIRRIGQEQRELTISVPKSVPQPAYTESSPGGWPSATRAAGISRLPIDSGDPMIGLPGEILGPQSRDTMRQRLRGLAESKGMVRGPGKMIGGGEHLGQGRLSGAINRVIDNITRGPVGWPSRDVLRQRRQAQPRPKVRQRTVEVPPSVPGGTWIDGKYRIPLDQLKRLQDQAKKIPGGLRSIDKYITSLMTDTPVDKMAVQPDVKAYDELMRQQDIDLSEYPLTDIPIKERNTIPGWHHGRIATKRVDGPDRSRRSEEAYDELMKQQDFDVKDYDELMRQQDIDLSLKKKGQVYTEPPSAAVPKKVEAAAAKPKEAQVPKVTAKKVTAKDIFDRALGNVPSEFKEPLPSLPSEDNSDIDIKRKAALNAFELKLAELQSGVRAPSDIDNNKNEFVNRAETEGGSMWDSVSPQMMIEMGGYLMADPGEDDMASGISAVGRSLLVGAKVRRGELKAAAAAADKVKDRQLDREKIEALRRQSEAALRASAETEKYKFILNSFDTQEQRRSDKYQTVFKAREDRLRDMMKLKTDLINNIRDNLTRENVALKQSEMTNAAIIARMWTDHAKAQTDIMNKKQPIDNVTLSHAYASHNLWAPKSIKKDVPSGIGKAGRVGIESALKGALHATIDKKGDAPLKARLDMLNAWRSLIKSDQMPWRIGSQFFMSHNYASPISRANIAKVLDRLINKLK